MNWKLIILLAITGPILAISGSYGLVSFGNEPYIVFVLFVLFAVLFAVYARGRYFLHGFITAFLFGATMSFIRLQMLAKYINTNPEAQDKVEDFLHKVSFIRSPILILFCLIVIFSIIAGFLAMIGGLVAKRK